MLSLQRQRCLDSQVLWNKFPRMPERNDSIVALECWKYNGMTTAQKDVNFRLLSLADGDRRDTQQQTDTEVRVEKWLRSKNPYSPLPAPQDAGECRGGLRLVLCDRPNMTPGMTISKPAFEMIEEAFHLHPATLPSFLVTGGACSSFVERDSTKDTTRRMQIVIKACQKVEIANYLLSISYDVQTGWTNAFMCGDGLIHDRSNDQYFGSQLQQLLGVVTNSPILWDNPLLLPCALFQNYAERTEFRVSWTEYDLIELENRLGVTHAGAAGLDVERERWPQDINPKETTIALHSLLPQIIFMSSCCRWLHDVSQFLLRLEKEMQADIALVELRAGFTELKEMVLFISSINKTTESSFTAFRERANLQVNVLFSVVSQQDSILNRWDSRLNHLIARSTKQDSISMTTFTFITAMFLPGTFIATLFSMTMFNWQSQSDKSSASQSSTSSSHVSNQFWIFWAVAIPLTLVTLGGWYAWFKYASRTWVKDLYAATVKNEGPTQVPSFPYLLPDEKIHGQTHISGNQPDSAYSKKHRL